jgi:hypothetical protein
VESGGGGVTRRSISPTAIGQDTPAPNTPARLQWHRQISSPSDSEPHYHGSHPFCLEERDRPWPLRSGSNRTDRRACRFSCEPAARLTAHRCRRSAKIAGWRVFPVSTECPLASPFQIQTKMFLGHRPSPAADGLKRGFLYHALASRPAGAREDSPLQHRPSWLSRRLHQIPLALSIKQSLTQTFFPFGACRRFHTNLWRYRLTAAGRPGITQLPPPPKSGN